MTPRRVRRPGAPQAEAIEPRVLLSTYVVINTNDSGPGSLRQAILDANANPGWDTIAFNIAGDSVHTIQPLTALPDLTDATTIDGYTQPGSRMNTGDSPGDDAVINIEIDGRLTSSPLQLHLNAPNRPFRVQGICLNHAGGIHVESTFAPVQIWGNFLGTDPTGMAASGSMQTDIDLEGATNADIGGDLPSMRNLIDNGSQDGVLINGGQSDQVRGNWVGIGADGHTAVGNRVGIDIENGQGAQVVRNVISGNRSVTAGDPLGGTGLSVSAHHSGIFAQNLVGTDAAGSTAVPNQGAGAIFDGNSLGSQVESNTFSGNAGDGLILTPATGTASGSVNLLIMQNQVGTDPSGTKPLGNGGSGIRVSAAGFFITQNTISGNAGNGIDVVASTTFTTSVLRNHIGTDPGGTLDLGNEGDGVRIEPGVSHVSVYGDTIAFNGGNGVTVGLSAGDTRTSGNIITNSSIYSNDHLGIDLANDGSTPNHVSGTGPNLFQPYPEFFARRDVGGTHVTATLIGVSTASGLASADFYASPPPAAGQVAQGQLFLGSYTLNAYVAGSYWLRDALLQQPVPEGWVLTATANNGRGTSEFSPPQLPHLSGDLNGDGIVDFTDLLALAGHFGQTGTLADGDANDDGTVNFVDLLILAQNYGHPLPAAATAAPAAASSDWLLPGILSRRRRLRI